MNTQRFYELQFWSRLTSAEGKNFLLRRKGDLERHLSHFDGKCDLKGKGIEFGTGCFSMLEFSEADQVIGIDPLANDFKNIFTIPNDKVTILDGDGENVTFNDNTFDWAVCWNVLDHTPNPERMVSEMFRVIKPKGKIYFNINFDDMLSPAHYSLWNEDVVDKCFVGKKQIYKKIIRNEPDQQYWFYAIYQK
jgi:ubiquinone/menaquinone biosynthesis C-methylase UbiE